MNADDLNADDVNADDANAEGGGPAASADPARLARALSRLADESRVRADVAELARSPRDRRHPEATTRARGYVGERLVEAGWAVEPVPFERRWVAGVSGAGGTSAPLRRLRLHRRLSGVNLLAELPREVTSPARPDVRPDGGSSPQRRPDTGPARQVLLVAHLDTVEGSPGADDNASGVAALIEAARLLATVDPVSDVRLAVVDLEEVGRVGSAVLAADPELRAGLRAVVCLESVGTFDDAPGSQRTGALGLLFPGLARQIRANGGRGDFALALCRRSSAGGARSLAAAAAALRPGLRVLTAQDPRPDGIGGLVAGCAVPPLLNLDRSDHAPFWNRGVPAMMVTTTAPFRNRHYHQAGDVAERVDSARVTALAVAVAATVATWPAEPG